MCKYAFRTKEKYKVNGMYYEETDGSLAFAFLWYKILIRLVTKIK